MLKHEHFYNFHQNVQGSKLVFLLLVQYMYTLPKELHIHVHLQRSSYSYTAQLISKRWELFSLHSSNFSFLLAFGFPQPASARDCGELVLHVSLHQGQKVQRMGLANLQGFYEIHKNRRWILFYQ